jgi:hypothetical protein
LVITDKNGVKIGKSQSDFKKYTITRLSHEAYKKSGGYSDDEMYKNL